MIDQTGNIDVTDVGSGVASASEVDTVAQGLSVVEQVPDLIHVSDVLESKPEDATQLSPVVAEENPVQPPCVSDGTDPTSISQPIDMRCESVDSDDWGFSSAPVIPVIEEEDGWAFDSAPPIDPLERFHQRVITHASTWAPHDVQMPHDTPRIVNTPITWREDLKTDLHWEDTESFKKFEKTLKGMIGGHKAALQASAEMAVDNERQLRLDEDR
jgi:hypothetical protein